MIEKLSALGLVLVQKLRERQLADQLEQKQVNLQVLDQNINTRDATGRLLFNILGAIAQFGTAAEAGAGGTYQNTDEGVPTLKS